MAIHQEILDRAVFLDRDGAIKRALQRDGMPYPLTSLAEFEIRPEGPAALAKETVEKVHAYMTAQLPIDCVELCFHPGNGSSDCDCRKPKPGMALHAAK